jgi:hypothetical protein
MAIWDEVIPEAERQIYAKGAWGKVVSAWGRDRPSSWWT